MRKIEKVRTKLFLIAAFIFGFGMNNALAEEGCSSKLFSVTIDSQLTISDVVENLADTCGLTVIVNDDAAKMRMNKKLYYVKLKNSTLKGFLNTILKDNDLHYSLVGNKLKISYLITKTFRIHYISGQRKGISTANVTIANPQSTAAAGTGGTSQGSTSGGSNDSRTGISIESNDEFMFWQNVEKEVQRILIGASDGSTHYTKDGDTWVGPDGKVWEYNPVAPIVNPDAGMITVTGTQKQIDRVSRYVKTLSDQLKSQVLIDVRILSVTFDDSTTSGVDWSQLFTLQNVTVNRLLFNQNNISSIEYDVTDGITDFSYADGVTPQNANALILTGKTDVSEVVKFLGTQGDVKAISSPRVMTLNNQPALISVGQEIFYKIKSSSTASSGGGAVAAEGEIVDSVFAGILLDITPEISSNGMITLKINPSVTDTVKNVAAESGVRAIPPDLVRRQIASVITVKNDQHAVLGGLITSKTGYNTNKVPLLGDLPLLEHAFKYEEKINKVEELVLIITPHIVKNSKDVSLKDLGYTKLNEK
ncbi:secretin N-terminal domain-containing protein [Sulfurovum sp. zt1-1]|uniref:Secretin N-terminal domain-containing protein n=1 Tax=Sulfurovum zhangzhouensis TaxID=3019067 RepID=A0ABT7QW56_9BACT|nr:pilus (MSHA type) biogenesis protein MshL [Sulfurovum zhangzhouensis]MDM5271018.1 secretin N-terminal domain-containing protein [Sulfurovum zhangzhouensis]